MCFIDQQRFCFCTKLATVNLTCASGQKSGKNVSEADISFIKSPNQIIFFFLYSLKSQSRCLSGLHNLYSEHPLNSSEEKLAILRKVNNLLGKKNKKKKPQEESQRMDRSKLKYDLCSTGLPGGGQATQGTWQIKWNQNVKIYTFNDTITDSIR